MYAVIATGGKQERVEVGAVIDVERLRVEAGEIVTFTPVLFVDDSSTPSLGDALDAVTVEARVLGDAKGPKITGFTYKPKARARRRFGHRQGYTRVEITSITNKLSASARARSTKEA